MKSIFYIIPFLILFSSCSSTEDNDMDVNDAFYICTEASTSCSDNSEGNTKGWGDYFDPTIHQNMPPSIYPLDYIYVIIHETNGLKWKNYKAYKIKLHDHKFHICFKMENGDLYIVINGEEILITNKKVLFSSKENNKKPVKLNKSTISTPNSKTANTYEPIGDCLFTSADYTFTFGYNQVIYSTNIGISGIIKNNQHFDLPLDRLTAVIEPSFVLCDNMEDSIGVNSWEMDYQKFATHLGKPEDWEVRCFFAGRKSLENAGYPVDFYINHNFQLFGDHYLIRNGAPDVDDFEDLEKGILALSKQRFPFEDNMKIVKSGPGGITLSYKGYGFVDTSYPYTYWIPITGELICYDFERYDGDKEGEVDLNLTYDLCYSFFYKGDNPKILPETTKNGERVITFRYPTDRTIIHPNYIEQFQVIVDTDDFIKAVTPSASTKSAASFKTYQDPDFGTTVVDMPAKIIVK